MPEQMLVGEFLPPYYISQLGNSIIITGSFNFGDFHIIYAWELEVDDGEVSSYRQLFSIPYTAEHELKLIGFTKDKQPIVEASIFQQLHQSLQVFNPTFGNFQNVGVEANHGNHIDNNENRYIYAWLLEVEAVVVTSWRVLFVMPSQNIAKLIGFTMDDDPIVVVDMGHEIVHMLQVYDRPSQQFHTLGIVDSIFRNFSITTRCSSGMSLHSSYAFRNSSLAILASLNWWAKFIIVLSLMDANFNNETDPWEFSLDIDDSDLHLTPSLHSLNNTHVESSTLIQNPVTIIHGHAAKLLKEKVFILDWDGALMSIQKYMQKIIEDVGEDDDFNSGAWVSATNYVMAFGATVTGCLGDIENFLKKGKLDHIVAIVKSCSPNMLGYLNVTLKDISCTIPGTIHYKVIIEGGYENDITVGAAMILKNVSVFIPKPSEHYLNITMRNVVEVFHKDTVLGSGTG
ncbi:hypothetical protein Tco_0526945 [Tanacetum coccineum]